MENSNPSAQETFKDSKSKVTTSTKSTAVAKQPVPEPEHTINIPKEPGWRCSSNSQLKEKRSQSTGDDDLNCNVKSETSISSNGPLREYYRASNERIKHTPKVHFEPDPKLIKEAVEAAMELQKLAIDQHSPLLKDTALCKCDSKTKKMPSRSESGGKLVCPVDPVGGYIASNLDNIELVVYEDDEEEDNRPSDPSEKSNRSGKIRRSQDGKSTSSRRSTVKTKAITKQSNPSSTCAPSAPPPNGSK